jgi:fumarylacetoacetate (FAA) hydrolase
MRLATLRGGGRDGILAVVRHDGQMYAKVNDYPTLQSALDDWLRAEPVLRDVARRLDGGSEATTPLTMANLCPPLPRAYEWVDGSAFLNHVRLVRRARGAEPPPTLETDPLVYQGGSGVFLAPTEDICLADPAWGLDFEAEIVVFLGDVPQGTKRGAAEAHIRLVGIANDITLRNLVPGELGKGFGFFQSKPATAFGPFAVTPDELGDAWRDGRLHLPVRSIYNGTLVGDPSAGPEMHFSFHDLIEHIARTRGFTAGTILGSGTVSNADRARGVSCLAERRMIEIIDTGKATTPFMAAGDTIAIEVLTDGGRNVFGRIDQRVVTR